MSSSRVALLEPLAGIASRELFGAAAKGAPAIAAHLRRAIVSGLYTYGDKLPPEREIARTLGASRTTVRNAIRQLQLDELVTRRVGSGTFVVHGTRDQEHDIAEVTSPLELIEVRLAIEPRMIRLAIMNGTPRDFAKAAEALHQLERSNDSDHFTRWDQTFHLSLAQATRNPLLVWIYRQINHVRSHAQWSAVKDKILTRSRIVDYNAEHRALFELARGRDTDAAVDLITKHLETARRDLVGANSG